VGKPQNVLLKGMITAQDIKGILESDEFGSELEELSSYAANIRQERPIVMLIAKHFWRRGHKVALEKKKCDLVVGETRIEFKFSFDSDTLSLEKELNRFDGNLEMLMQAVSAKEMSGTWTVSPAIYNDVIVKRPEIFVWILCTRDLSKLTSDELSRVCIASHQQWYNRSRPYESSQRFLEAFEGLLAKLKELRNFSLEKIQLSANNSFPSVYYFMVCEFTEV
jgi:hypothetical protein